MRNEKQLRREVDTWKDKILDYEIEILWLNLGTVLTLTWKDKILDYEIEIRCIFRAKVKLRLEKIRFSITRLKSRRIRDAEIDVIHLKR